MRRYDPDDEVDVAVVGCGAGGGVLAQRLARRGWQVVAFDAGPFWDPDRDWVSDEAGSHDLYWNEPRVISGSDPVALGNNNSGRGVGGSMVHFAGYAPRFHPSDFHTCPRDGVGADWPIDYARPQALLRSRWRRSCRWPASAGPGATRTATRSRPHPMGGNGMAFLRGLRALGIEARDRPGRHRQRPLREPSPLHLSGLLPPGLQGQRQGVAAITHVPDALAHGAEIRADCMVARHRGRPNGRATGVTYFHQGREYRQRARLVAVAGYSIETPRLLLNSACPAVPRRSVQRLRPGWPLRDGAGRAPDGRALRRGGPLLQGATAGGLHRGFL